MFVVVRNDGSTAATLCGEVHKSHPTAGVRKMQEWSLAGRERSRPLQTKIRSAVVGNF